MPVIGFLHSGSSAPYAHLVAAFRQSLKEAGYVEGESVAIEYRWAEGHYDRLPALAADLVGRHVTLIVAQGGDPPVLAAKSTTATIPVVFTSSSDPVKLGLVTSLNHPGGNVTGFWPFTSLLGTKRLELVRQLVSANSSIVVLVNPDNPNAGLDMAQLEDSARALGQSVSFVRARTEAEIEVVFAILRERRVSALLVNTNPFFLARPALFVSLAARNRIPAIYAQREFVAAGGAELAKVIRRLQPDDVLVVTRLDRLARSTHDLLNVLATIGERQASFRSLKDTWADTTTPHGRLMLTVLGGLAEFERELIRARTGDGRVRAKARGVRFGRPAVLSAHQRQEALQRLANGEAQADLARSYGVSQPTISRLRRTILAGLLALPLSAQAQPAFYPETGQNPVERAEAWSRLLKAEREKQERAEVQCLKPNGQLEPCELRQQSMPRLSRPAINWLVLPPPEYDKPFPGKLQEIRVPPETMRAICPKTPLPLTLACTYPTHDQRECLIIMVSDEIIRAAGWSPEIVRRHEVGHCNGFPSDHRGMRPLTLSQW